MDERPSKAIKAGRGWKQQLAQVVVLFRCLPTCTTGSCGRPRKRPSNSTRLVADWSPNLSSWPCVAISNMTCLKACRVSDVDRTR